LNGTILGMTRAEIKRKFDEIVAFAEVEKYLDTPVKRYSSGMYVRLAFAVAAHLEPEILVVDEVLAVGDAAFQKKCLGKMGDVAKEGRTVLFVSHNMGAIQRLCPQSIWIDVGILIRFEPSDKVVHAYLNRSSGRYLSGQMELSSWPNRYGSGEARILSARILDENQNTTTTVCRAGFMAVEFIFESKLANPLHFSMVVMSDSGEKILHLSYYDTPGVIVDSLIGRYRACFSIPALPLCSGNYYLVLAIHTQNLIPIDVVLDVLPFIAEDMGNSPRHYKTVNEYAYCWTPNHFSIAPLN
jgi:lipopolysaccharide transport system ATP-binding protein